jgi:endo-1,4-beta-xylanase
MSVDLRGDLGRLAATRRGVLAGVSAGMGALMAGLPTQAVAAESERAAGPSLQALARQSGRNFGTAINAVNAPQGSVLDAEYAALTKRECGVLVAENEMKIYALRNGYDTFDFTRPDKIAAFARGAGLALRGHNLIWARPQYMPKWIKEHDFGTQPASTAGAWIDKHVQTVMGRYQGQITSWDVVNEAIVPGTGEYEVTTLSQAMGGTLEMIDYTFRAARAAGPQVELVYNDYMGWENGSATHRKAVLKLLEDLRKKGTPVDALGVQSHLDGSPVDQREWRKFLDEVVGMGYGLIVTEFDVRDGNLPADVAVRDKGVADAGKAFLDIMLSYKQCGDVLAWGLVDSFSWLQGFGRRKDGQAVRGCPYDADYKAKPLREAVAQALIHAAPYQAKAASKA